MIDYKPVSLETATDAVRNAWQAAMPSVPFDPGKSWSDIGLDSLKALEFVFRLERTLGCTIGFDSITSDSNAAYLIAHLAGGDTASGDDTRFPVFLLPGLMGDEPKLSLFRNAFGREVRFHTLDLPGIGLPSRIHKSIRATATWLVDEIIRLQPEGDIHLAGYSFGGLVAQDMTRQLEARGRRVGFLVVLDGMLRPVLYQDDMPSPAAKDSLGQKMQEGRQAFFDRALFSVFFRLNLWGAARLALLYAAPRHDWAWVHKRSEWLFIRLRNWAVLIWRPGICQARTLLVTSTDFPTYSSISKWRKICPNLSTLTVSASHSRIFEPEPLGHIVSAFRQLVAAPGKE